MKIEIKGSCVTREAFNYTDKYQITNYIFQKPLKVMYSSPVSNFYKLSEKIKIDLLNNGKVRDFVVNQVDTSFNKQFLKNDAEYIILDFIDERMPILKFNNGTYIEYREEIEENFKKYGIDYKRESGESLDIYLYVDLLFKHLLQVYPKEKIILHKAYAVNQIQDGKNFNSLSFSFVEPKNKIMSSEKIFSKNNFLIKIYEYIEQKYPYINFIELDYKKYYIPADHRFGRAPYHYNEEYYFDFLFQLNNIVENGNNNAYFINKDRNIETFKNMKSAVNSDLHFFERERLVTSLSTGTVIEDYNRTIKTRDSGLLLKKYNNINFRVGYLIYDSQRNPICKLLFKNKNMVYLYCIADGEFTRILRSDGIDINLDSTIGKLNASKYQYNFKDIRITFTSNNEEVKLFIDEKKERRVFVFDSSYIKFITVYSKGVIEEQLNFATYKYSYLPSHHKSYRNGKIHNIILYNFDGSLCTKLIFKDKDTYHRKLFYRNNKISSIIEYSSLNETKLVKNYNEDGDIIKISSYFPGNKIASVGYLDPSDKKLVKLKKRKTPENLFENIKI